MLLPVALSWFRFDAGHHAHLGLLEPGGKGGPQWFDAGPADVPALLARGGLRTAHLRELQRQATAMPAPQRFLPPLPLPLPGKILCMAKNYVAHAREFGAEAPKEPIFFSKLPDTLCAHGAPVVIPHWLETRVDHEAELALILGFPDREGRGRKYVSAAHAKELVAGYTALNDVTARKLQGQDRDEKYPWLRSKSFDTFCPYGPWVVPADAIDGDALDVEMLVNGETRQRANTRDMVFSIPAMLEAMSRHTTLRPGDLIATGTPEGVSAVQAGDRMVVRLAGVGELHNEVVKEAAPR